MTPHNDLEKAKQMVAACPTLAAKIRMPEPMEIPLISEIFFRELTDKEFTIVYNLPLTIRVSAKTESYIQARRMFLKLRRPQHEKLSAN